MKRIFFKLSFLMMSIFTLYSCNDTQKKEIKKSERTIKKETKKAKKAIDKEAVTIKKNLTLAKYQCPMKCEGEKIYHKSGQCPKCNMDLKKIED